MLFIDHFGLWLDLVGTKFNYVLRFLCYVCRRYLWYMCRGRYLSYHGVKIRRGARFGFAFYSGIRSLGLGFYRNCRRPSCVLWRVFLNGWTSSICFASWSCFGFPSSGSRFMKFFNSRNIPRRRFLICIRTFQKLRRTIRGFHKFWGRFTIGQAALRSGRFVCRRFSSPFFKFCSGFLWFTWLGSWLCARDSSTRLFCICRWLIFWSSLRGNSLFSL